MIERRPSPRYQVETPVVVYFEKSARFTGLTRDASRGGLGLELGRHAVEALAQGGSVLTTGDRFRVEIDGVPGGPDPVVVACRTSFVRRLAQDRYAIGAQFQRFEAGEARYDAFLARCASEAPPGAR